MLREGLSEATVIDQEPTCSVRMGGRLIANGHARIPQGGVGGAHVLHGATRQAVRLTLP